MKLQNPKWLTASPGGFPDGMSYQFMELVRRIAGQARIKQEVFEDFKSHLAGDKYSRSSTEYDAEWDLYRLMDERMKNAPVFISNFADACADFGKMGYRVPSVQAINDMIPYSIGFSINSGGIVVRRPRTGDDVVIHVPPLPPRPIVEFGAMKLQNPDWAFDSPGLIRREILQETKSLIGKIAARAEAKDVFETFKAHFAAARGEASTYGSSSTSWAQSDMEREMDDAAGNAPLFIAAFADGCSELREQGVGVPSVDRINQLLSEHDAGYQINGGTVVATGQHITFQPPQENPPPPTSTMLFTGHAPTATTASVLLSSKTTAKAKTLQVFLCHSRADKAAVKELFKKLKADGYNPWLDAVNLIGGQDWEFEIKKAVKASDIVLVCLSSQSVTKAGFMQKEIKFALDVADEQPEGVIFIIPARLEECDVPARLSHIHWIDLFGDDGYEKLIQSLTLRAATLT